MQLPQAKSVAATLEKRTWWPTPVRLTGTRGGGSSVRRDAGPRQIRCRTFVENWFAISQKTNARRRTGFI
jgi:hypothetical protein